MEDLADAKSRWGWLGGCWKMLVKALIALGGSNYEWNVLETVMVGRMSQRT